jgi:hypothetical protein
MKRFFISLIIISGFYLTGVAQNQEKPNLMSGRYGVAELQRLLTSQQPWKPFPTLGERGDWARADQKMMKATYDEALKLLDYEWPSIPATTTLLFVRTGDRDEYQGLSFRKRTVLGTLLLAEIQENQDRFLDQIIDGVWSICEESYWGVPAHLGQSRSGSGLPNVTDPYVDLFAAETATFLAWVDYFLGEKLDAVSPLIRKRIYDETNHRIFTPVMSYTHPWMVSNKAGRRPNNWNPWICSNWLNAALLLEKDEKRKAEMVGKILVVLDEFLNPHPLDGGCDEGPSYWGAAAASLYDNISLLNLATNDAFRYVLEDEKVINMGKYIYRAQISEKYFMNFADADPQPTMAASMIWRYGKDIGDVPMQEFGAWYRKEPDGKAGRFHFFRSFFELFLDEEFAKAPKRLPLPSEVWLPDLEVMVARDQEGSTEGFYLAAKGGNNDESHNHNDIGNYMVYYNGLPLVIDVGRGTYTAKTFSGRRYEIWYNRSDYHNLPTINGETQPAGASYKAVNAAFSGDKNFAQLALDIAPSYPETAGIKSWNRTVRLNRGKNVVITDNAQLTKAESIVQHLMTCWPSEVVKPGELVIHFMENGQSKDFVVRYNASRMEASVEKMVLDAPEDKGIISKWGDTIYRINLRVKQPRLKEQFKFEIAAR